MFFEKDDLILALNQLLECLVEEGKIKEGDKYGAVLIIAHNDDITLVQSHIKSDGLRSFLRKISDSIFIDKGKVS